jgi:hypothetical protein
MPAIPKTGVLERTRDWLRGELAEGGRLRERLIPAARAAGYSVNHVSRAATQLGVVADRVKVDGKGWRARWQLPEGATPAPKYSIPDLPEPSRPEPVTDDAIPTISATFAELAKMSRMVDVYRYTDGEASYLDSVPSIELSLRALKKRYGGGRYRVEGVTFVIEGPSLPADGTEPAPRPRNPGQQLAAPAAPGGQLDITQLFLSMMNQQSTILTALLTNRGGSDPVAMFKAVDDAVARRLTVSSGPATPVDQALALLERGMKLGAERAEVDGDGPADGGFGATIKAVAPFLNALAKRIELPGAGAPALAAGSETSTGSEAAPPPAAPLIPLTNMQSILSDLEPILPQLCENAKRGTDPGAVVTFILQNASDDQYDALAGASESPQFVDELMGELATRIPQQSAFALPWLRTLAVKLNDVLAKDRAGNSDANGAG